MKTYKDLLALIERTSEEGVTLEEAERAAAMSLGIMNTISESLKTMDKDVRYRKAGLKAIKSAVRLEAIKSADGGRKPTEGQLEDAVNMSEIVQGEQDAFDTSEVDKEELERQYSICKESHLYFRGISRGRFE